jgi:uncharacterized protein (DUF1778 family)
MTVGKRYPLNMRTTKAVRDRLEAAARASGRSLTQEVEFRLEQSFLTADMREFITEAVEEATATAIATALRIWLKGRQLDR